MPSFPRLALPFALALALSACGSDAPPGPGGAPGAPGGAPGAVPVSVVTLKAQSSALERELAGRTSPSLIAEVRPQITGLVERRLFTEGGYVRAGQPLYSIDDSAYRSTLDSAQAALARAEAGLTTARLNAQRSAELVKIDAISRQDADNAQAAFRQAQADVNAQRAALRGAGVTVGFTRITAPISGQIGRSNVTQGALVTAAQPAPLATIQQLDPMYVDVTQSSSELLALRRESTNGGLSSGAQLPVRILLEDGSPHSHEGRLAFSEATVDPTTGSYTVRIVVPNPQGVLMPGMYVRAVLTSGVRPNAVLVPQRGVTRDPKGNASAMVVGAGNKVEVRPVQVSRTLGDSWLVESGLKPGDRVIVEGLQRIAPGAVVAPTEAVDAPARTPAPAAAAGAR
jgi:membrane fusion protein (multidrug efflux system)